MSYHFELGPIRPPSEANSILLRVTRNCPWNKCTFCHTYKETRFSRRTVKDVMKDIDSIHCIAERIIDVLNSSGGGGVIDEVIINNAIKLDNTPEYYYQQVAFWLQNKMKTAFLQDANSLILKTSDLVDILSYFKEKFPSIERITTYARAKTVSKKTKDELIEIRKAGLSRIHIGMESGSDKVLDFIKKGVNASEQILAGKNAVNAGFDLSEYYMPGLGGKGLSEENAIESARVLNEINPTFIRIRSAVPIPGTGLSQAMSDNLWTPLSEEEKVKELRLFIENLNGITSSLLSDHMMNLLEDLGGKFPEDKEKMLSIIDKFLNMSTENKENYIIGRRLGYYRYISEFTPDPRVENIRSQLKKKFSSIDEAISEILKNYI